jgi:5-hydroxyisourate hydrolase
VTAPITRISTHVLDAVLGRPGQGIPAVLEMLGPDGSVTDVGHGATDDDGRVIRLNDRDLPAGEYRLTLSTGGYFQEHHTAVFYPTIAVQFVLPGEREHYHIAVLASTYSYTTYLGS